MDAPEQVIAAIAPDAVVTQFGYGTWQTPLQGITAADAYSAFVHAGYTPLDASVVQGAHTAPLVLASNDAQVTLYPTEDGVRLIWDAAGAAAQKLLLPNESTGTGEVTMVQIGVARNQTTDNPAIGMCYVYRLSDGRAVILDGGIPGNETVIYQALQTLDVAKDADGNFDETVYSIYEEPEQEEQLSKEWEDAKRWSKMDQLAKELTAEKRLEGGEEEEEEDPDRSMRLSFRAQGYGFRGPGLQLRRGWRPNSREDSVEAGLPLRVRGYPEEKKEEEGSANRRPEVGTGWELALGPAGLPH